MRQAIEVKYHGPTNVRGSRYKATCAAGSRILSADDSLSHQENAKAAALALASKLQWRGTWSGGVVKNGTYVFVQDDGDAFSVEGTR